jgi:uncharacterized membrane protein (UPF0127 family)
LSEPVLPIANRGQLVRAADGAVLLTDVERATGFWHRFVGLQFRRRILEDYGLWLRPCSSIHTCFVRFPIDVIMLDDQDRVLGIRRAVRPWRAVVCERGTRSVIETVPQRLDLQPGERLRFQAAR